MLTLPEPIAAYFAAQSQTPEALAQCFTPQASVMDEGRTYTGHEAIAAWKAAASAQYRYTTQPLALEPQEQFQVVRARVSGNFPGSPVDLHHCFRLDGNLIAALEIAP